MDFNMRRGVGVPRRWDRKGYAAPRGTQGQPIGREEQPNGLKGQETWCIAG